MKQIRSFGLMIIAGVLWWGLVYPELCFMKGTYEVAFEVTEEALEAQKELETEELGEGSFKGLFEAGPDKIILKSIMIRK